MRTRHLKFLRFLREGKNELGFKEYTEMISKKLNDHSRRKSFVYILAEKSLEDS